MSRTQTFAVQLAGSAYSGRRRGLAMVLLGLAMYSKSDMFGLMLSAVLEDSFCVSLVGHGEIG